MHITGHPIYKTEIKSYWYKNWQDVSNTWISLSLYFPFREDIINSYEHTTRINHNINKYTPDAIQHRPYMLNKRGRRHSVLS